MNAKKCKMLRKAAGFGPVEYEKPELHHAAHMPQYQTYERVIREMGAVNPGAPTNTRHGIPRAGERRYAGARIETWVRMDADGKTPVVIIERRIDPKTGVVTMVPAIQPVLVPKPAHLKRGSPREVYKVMKRMEREEGIDRVFAQLLEGSGVPV